MAWPLTPSCAERNGNCHLTSTPCCTLPEEGCEDFQEEMATRPPITWSRQTPPSTHLLRDGTQVRNSDISQNVFNFSNLLSCRAPAETRLPGWPPWGTRTPSRCFPTTRTPAYSLLPRPCSCFLKPPSMSRSYTYQCSMKGR